jgi:DNA-binding transcriptional regulator YdaS (Cro superfamily)
MDLKSYLEGEGRGRLTLLAASITAQSQLVWQWANGVRSVPDTRCPSIERATDGAVTCEELRPDVKWSRIKDKAWPHPQGRPVIDVARVEAA